MCTQLSDRQQPRLVNLVCWLMWPPRGSARLQAVANGKASAASGPAQDDLSPHPVKEVIAKVLENDGKKVFDTAASNKLADASAYPHRPIFYMALSHPVARGAPGAQSLLIPALSKYRGRRSSDQSATSPCAALAAGIVLLAYCRAAVSSACRGAWNGLTTVTPRQVKPFWKSSLSSRRHFWSAATERISASQIGI